jgi:isoprenylcysteine carboxyl methyltransferase (ICMT) family protein YpbQ
LAVGLTYGAVRHPNIALAIALALLAVIVACSALIIRFVKRRFRKASV